MNQILQGTTPTINFDFSDSGISVGDITAAELTVVSKATKITHALSDLSVDSVNGTISYTFTEAETLALDFNSNAFYQLYVEADGVIFGTKKAPVDIFQKIKGEAMA